MPPIPRLRAFSGPALLSYGFRPFFLFGSIFAGLAILLWIPAYSGDLEIATTFAPVDWHVHEMLYGFVAAVVTGFMLTAIPNWTGRLPLQGRPLLGLVLLWGAGRLAVSVSAWIGWGAAAIVDALFLTAVILAATREIAAGRNWRNLPVVGAVLALLAGNIAFHLEAHFRGGANIGIRLGLAAALMMVALIGGRIIPSFTRNWLVRENPGRLPVPFNRFDGVCLIVGGLALAVWVAMPDHPVTGVLLFGAGALHLSRMVRWAGFRTGRDRLVLVLHLAYAFMPVGFALSGAAAFGWVPAAAGIHAWSIGTIALMTLAVMSRASLGHTGRTLVASVPLQIIYGLLVLAAVLRIAAALRPEWSLAFIPASGLAWAGAFLGFGLTYWQILTGPRVKQPG